MERVFGIDVSTYQKDIDWAKVKAAGVKFAIIRVGYRGYGKSGNIKLDDCFEKNIKGALANNIAVGVYFYSQALNEQEAIEEANFVLSNILPYKNHITLPVVFDFEGFSKTNQRVYGMKKPEITKCCIAFQDVIKANGFTCMLYGSQSYLPKKYDLDKLTDPLWVARYPSSTKPNSDEKNFPKVNGYQDRIAVWQYASCGTVDGIGYVDKKTKQFVHAKVDMNYMYIDVSTNHAFSDEKEEIEEKEDDSPMKIYKKGVAVQLSKNFKSTEFDCNGKGCCSETPISTDLVKILQQVRDHFGVSVNLNCGYRCPEHNAKVKGASKNSKHMDGIASDIVVKGVHPMRVARYIETLPEFKGRIGVYTWDDKGNGFVHVDVRGTNSRAVYTKNNTEYDTVPSFHVAVKQGMKGHIVKVVQRKLKSEKVYFGLIDGKCGKGTTAGIMKFNAKHGRLNDASWGKKCWNEAFPI
jgi:GH25 family lysozyme M1 (1,4-beta-N-acetylmuramidase)